MRNENLPSNVEQGRNLVLQIGGTIWLFVWFLYACVHLLLSSRGAAPTLTTLMGLATYVLLAFVICMPIAVVQLWRRGPKSLFYLGVAALPVSLLVVAWASLLLGWGRQ